MRLRPPYNMRVSYNIHTFMKRPNQLSILIFMHKSDYNVVYISYSQKPKNSNFLHAFTCFYMRGGPESV